MSQLKERRFKETGWLLGSIVGVQISNGLKTISNVFYALEVSQNPLNVGQLVDDGYKLTFRDRACTMKDSVGIELLTVGMRNKCFPLDWMKVNHATYKCTLTNAALWHNRFGYVSYGSLMQMASNDMVVSLPRITKSNKVYDICQFGRQKREPFPKTGS
ncbi:Uncharacterized protein TCM_012329 [Theobroma cacao]|uniref:GAG-pre-integrase domain-containing protein n=1 Tax=Theobroma cacao TaxID=3641 RepID=A0A061FV92_THECC|nr:Uncharacterized protein TCM_012329 [Theobroma cacao]